MGAVLEDVENGHRQVGESVDENGLELALGIVADDHGGTDLLVEGEGCVFTVDLFPESKEETGDQDGSKVLHKEDCSPADLHTEILKKYGHKSFVVRLKITVNVRAEQNLSGSVLSARTTPPLAEVPCATSLTELWSILLIAQNLSLRSCTVIVPLRLARFGEIWLLQRARCPSC